MEAGPVRLCHDQRLETGARAGSAARARRVDGPDAAVDEVHDLALVHVDRDDDALDRPVVGVGELAAVERQRPHQARTGRGRGGGVARRPDVDVDVVRVQAAIAHRLLERRVRVHERVDQAVLAQRDGRLGIRTRRPRDELLRSQVDDCLVELVRAPVVDVGERAAGELRAGAPGGRALGGLVELDEREERAGRELLAPLDHAERRENLVRRQRVEWVDGRRRAGVRDGAPAAGERCRPDEPGGDEDRQRGKRSDRQECSALGHGSPRARVRSPGRGPSATTFLCACLRVNGRSASFRAFRGRGSPCRRRGPRRGTGARRRRRRGRSGDRSPSARCRSSSLRRRRRGRRSRRRR